MLNIKDAVHLIDDDSVSSWGKIRTGWDYESDGEGPEQGLNRAYWCLNTDRDGEVYLRRDCVAFEGGVMTFEGLMDNVSGDGLYYSFGSRTESFVKLVTKGEALYAGDAKVADFAYGRHYVKLIMDLTKDTFQAVIDNRDCGSFPYAMPVFPFNCLKIGYGDKDRGAAHIYFCKLYVNYLFFDYNLNNYLGAMPDGFSVKASRGAVVESGIRVEGKTDTSYICRGPKGAKTVVTRPFEKASGPVTFEMKYLQNEAKGTITVSLLRGFKTVVSVSDAGEALKCYCGTTLRTHHINVWQTLRIEADTDSGKATIWLNGKLTKTVPFENAAKAIDAFRITYEADEASRLMFSDMRVWIRPEEPEDYVPMPVVPKKKGDYVVGMNICSLWREGSHQGWDCITPYDDIKPVLGYYDEGLPEVSDWEIKFMVEHGIDYELYCWYSAEVRDPIKSTHLHYAWLDGHFYAKYADMEKFALLWEAANCSHPTCLEDFKANLVPYWLDYFFSDDRYMRVDNKAIMSCFGVWCVERDLGGADKVREGLQYLRDEVKKLGYDDLIVMGCHADPNQLKALGFDAFHAYHWGSEGYSLEHNIRSNDQNMAKNAVHIVPTISVGFKNVGWGGDRRPLLSNQNMYNGLQYCIDNYLPKQEQGTWKAKMLHVSTWNEYGEGTYMMPSTLNGFGYLDAVRKAVCVDEPHEDAVPTESQMARLSYLRVQSRRKLGRMKYDVRPLPETDTPYMTFEFKTKKDLKKWSFENVGNLRIEDGVLMGESTADGPAMELKDCAIDAASVAFAKIECTNVLKDTGAPQLFTMLFANDEAKRGFDHTKNNRFWCTDRAVAEYTLQLDTNPMWSGTIHGLRLLPVERGSFAIRKITLYASVPHTTVYNQAGRVLYFGDYLMEKGGEVYIPLDPDSGIYRALGYKYEWFRDDLRLEMWDPAGDRVTVKVGCPYVTKNGENFTLIRPVFLKDGIPTLALSDIETVFGIRAERDGRKVYLK